MLHYDTTLNKYPGLFSDGVGTFSGPKVRIHVSADAQPLFHKARPVPYMMQSMIKCELDHLQSEVIISPVEYSDWAAPIVPILKADETVHICGENKTTINYYSKLDGYPLPKAEDMFTTLMDGQTFTKLDLTMPTCTHVCMHSQKRLMHRKRAVYYFALINSTSIYLYPHCQRTDQPYF